MNVRLVALLTLLLALVAAPALAYTPPQMTGYVTDAAGVLTESQRLALDRKLLDYDHRTGNQVAVFIAKSLEGESIDVVGADTGRAWHVGAKGKDNGVLLVIAPVERKAEIATGKGVEGALTDLQTNDIIHQKLQPRLKPGHEDWNAAVEDTTDAIMAALDAGGTGGGPATPPPPRPASAGDVLFALVFFALMLGIPILFVVLLIRGLVSAFTSNGRSASRGWASGSSWSNDSSWSSSPSDSSWSSGGDSGSSFDGSSGDIGGGGDFGGGGSSDSF